MPFCSTTVGEIIRIPCGIIHIERRKFAFRIMLFMFRFTQELPGDDACEQRRCSFIIFHIQPAFQKRTIRQGNVRIFAVCDHRGSKKPRDGRNRVAVPNVVQRVIPFRRKVGDCCKRKRRTVLRKRDLVFFPYVCAPCASDLPSRCRCTTSRTERASTHAMSPKARSVIGIPISIAARTMPPRKMKNG